MKERERETVREDEELPRRKDREITYSLREREREREKRKISKANTNQ